MTFHRVALPATGEHLKAASFFHRHYLVAGESFTSHAAAVLTGTMLMVVGLVLAPTVVMLPVGVVIGLLGLFTFGGGIFAHFIALAVG